MLVVFVWCKTCVGATHPLVLRQSACRPPPTPHTERATLPQCKAPPPTHGNTRLPGSTSPAGKIQQTHVARKPSLPAPASPPWPSSPSSAPALPLQARLLGCAPLPGAAAPPHPLQRQRRQVRWALPGPEQPMNATLSRPKLRSAAGSCAPAPAVLHAPLGRLSPQCAGWAGTPSCSAASWLPAPHPPPLQSGYH